MRPPKKRQGGRYWDLPDKEWLEYHYVTLEKTTAQVGAECGVGHKQVSRWLKAFDIRIRGRWRGGGYKYRRQEARRVAQECGIPQMCEHCGTTQGLVVHHKNGDWRDNQPENLQRLCRSCHSSLHTSAYQRELSLLSKLEKYEKALRELGADPDDL